MVAFVQGMFFLTSWLMKSKRAPWHTAKTGQGWHIAGQRYMDIVPGQQVIHVKAKVTHAFLYVAFLTLPCCTGRASRHLAASFRWSRPGRETCFAISSELVVEGTCIQDKEQLRTSFNYGVLREGDLLCGWCLQAWLASFANTVQSLLEMSYTLACHKFESTDTSAVFCHLMAGARAVRSKRAAGWPGASMLSISNSLGCCWLCIGHA